MFVAAKLLAFVTQPLAWVTCLVLASLLLHTVRPVLARRLGWAGLALLVVLGWEPLPEALLRHFEAQYPPLTTDASLSGYAGVVVLGGALESAYVWTAPGQSALNDAAERMTEVIPLLHRNPALRVLFTGGSGELFGDELSEADRALAFFRGQGVPLSSLLFESASRTTYENALLGRAVPGVDAHRPWLLVTSAWHMPRAVATFRRVGWNVTACPVDFRTGHATPWSHYGMDSGVTKWRIALHELVGLWAYHLTGRA